MKNSSKILIALGAGLAIGGLLGILFAPNKGSETRKKIVEAEKKLADQIKDAVTRSKIKISGMKEGMKERMEAANEKVEEFA